MEIKPIETIYNGYRFRSRLEARWAVFFDALGIKYEYENEGYDLGEAGWYLPDFWLPKEEVFIEIRPSDKYIYDAKCEALSLMTSKYVLYIAGSPYLHEYQICLYENGKVDIEPFEFADCRRCRGLWLSRIENHNYGSSDGMIIGLGCDSDCTAYHAGRYPLPNGERICNAYKKSRGARFEHRECE